MGRKQFQSLTVSLPSKTTTAQTLTESSVIAAGGSEEYTVYAPAGTLATIYAAYVDVPAPTGVTAGKTHQVQVLLAGQSTLTEGDSKDTDAIIFYSGEWQSATSQQMPRAGMESYWLAGNIAFTPSNALAFYYGNGTNAAQNGTRTYQYTALLESTP